MLQPAQNQSPKAPANSTTYTPVRAAAGEQATIGASVVIKGEISGSEPLYIDGKVEGSIHVSGQRVTIGRSGSVTANIDAKEVVIMGSVKGNIQCTDRLDIRAEGSLTGDVAAPRVSVEDGAMLKGSVDVRSGSQKQDKAQNQKSFTTEADKPKAASAVAGA
ncbi:MAG: polymer-forming cytoskeletal protein [Acidobacteriaceae bacterium]|nr:polymer-forming cytoskeletal protein [Acidobacteriaceae bacterium]